MKKAITLILDPVTLVIEGETEEELLQNAQKAYIQQLESKFPHFTYSVNEENVLTYDTVKPGMIVKTNDGKGKGIVTAVLKKNIHVTLTGHRDVKGPPQAFQASSATFEDVRSRRTNEGQSAWREGDTGYLTVNKGIVGVVIGKKSGAKYKVYQVGGKEGYYTLDEAQMNAFIKDETETNVAN